MKDITFTLSGDALWLCDMRPGLTQDGVSIAVTGGIYGCRVIRDAMGLASVEYLKVGYVPSRQEKVGSFSIDMARIGVVELAPLLTMHDGDWAELSEWSDEAADARQSAWGGRLTSKAPHAVFFDTGRDCEIEVIRLRSGRETVGFRLVPKEAPKVGAKARKWTWVDVKVRGIGESWSFCDDWDYEPDDDLIYDNIDSGISWTHETEQYPDVRLDKLCPKIRGIEEIKVFIETAHGQEMMPRRKVELQIPKLPRIPTPRQLRAAVFSLFKAARKKGLTSRRSQRGRSP